MAVKPRTIIFVPGAWHTTKSYDIVIKKLEQAGYPGELVRVELPSVGPQPGDPVMYSIRPDVQAVEKAIAEQVDKGTPVLLVAHSYGSVVASCALKDFANSGLVNWLIVAGFLLEFGQSLLDLCGGVPPPLWNKQGDFLLPNDPEQAFYNDLPVDMQKTLVARLQPQSFAVNISPINFEGWAAVPTTYIAATKDGAIPIVVQEAMIDMVKARGIALDVETFSCGHSVMISEPDKLLSVIQRLAN